MRGACWKEPPCEIRRPQLRAAHTWRVAQTVKQCGRIRSHIGARGRRTRSVEHIASGVERPIACLRIHHTARRIVHAVQCANARRVRVANALRQEAKVRQLLVQVFLH